MARLPDSITIGGISIPVTVRPVTTKGREMTRETTTIYPNQPDSTFPEFRKAGDALKSALTEAKLRNREGAPTQSRELSLAITNMEQALHWLGCAPVKRDAAKVVYTVDDAQVAYPPPPADEQCECPWCADADTQDAEQDSEAEVYSSKVALERRRAENPDSQEAYPSPPAGVYGVTAQEWTEVVAPALEGANSRIEELTALTKRLQEERAVMQRERDEAQEQAEKAKAAMAGWVAKYDALRAEQRRAGDEWVAGFLEAVKRLDNRLEYT